jgi:tungstate transport system substrate-binding protein
LPGSRGILYVLALVSALVACQGRPDTGRALDLATTTSVHNSGLLDALRAAYTDRVIHAHAAGSGRALEMLADGIVDVVISHAPDTEARYLAQHTDWSYRKLAYNAFVVIGPSEDPAGIRGSPGVIDAFWRIAASGSAFVSRGDQSGTHEREEALWKLAGVKPAAANLLVSGRGMALAIRHADERRAYTLSDQATWWQFEQQLKLELLLEGDALLLNTYAVIHPRYDEAAAALASWLVEGAGRTVIRDYTVGGRPAFAAWPVSCPGRRPDAVPCEPF